MKHFYRKPWETSHNLIVFVARDETQAISWFVIISALTEFRRTIRPCLETAPRLPAGVALPLVCVFHQLHVGAVHGGSELPESHVTGLWGVPHGVPHWEL